MIKNNKFGFKKIILITSPPRSGNLFLMHLLQDYFPKNLEIDVVFSMHDVSFLSVKSSNIFNILIYRDPVEILSSCLEFYKESGLSKETLIKKIIESIEQFYRNFLKSPNNILVSFEVLKKDPVSVIKYICETLGIKYDNEYVYDYNRIKKINTYGHKISTRNLPDKKMIDILEKNYKFLSSLKEVQDIVLQYNCFIEKCIKIEAKGIYV